MQLFRYSFGIFLIIIASIMALVSIDGFQQSALYSIVFVVVALVLGFGGVKLIRRANQIERENPERANLITSDEELGGNFISQETFSQVDLSRFSAAGWLLLLVSIGSCLLVVILSGFALDLDPEKDRMMLNVLAFIGLGVAGAVFMGGRMLIRKMGYALFKRPSDKEQKDSRSTRHPDDPWE